MEILKAPLFDFFLSLCDNFAEQLYVLKSKLETKQEQKDEFLEELDTSSDCFSSEECLLKNVRLLLYYFSVIDLEVC